MGTKVSEAEFALLEERARGAGLRLAERVREALLAAPVEPGMGSGVDSGEVALAEVLALRSLLSICTSVRRRARQWPRRRCRLLNSDSVGFELGRYDHSRPLVIDPILDYATYVDGSGNDAAATGIAVDAAGEAFITGWTVGNTAFPKTPGAFQTTVPYSGDGDSSVFPLR